MAKSFILKSLSQVEAYLQDVVSYLKGKDPRDPNQSCFYAMDKARIELELKERLPKWAKCNYCDDKDDCWGPGIYEGPLGRLLLVRKKVNMLIELLEDEKSEKN